MKNEQSDILLVILKSQLDIENNIINAINKITEGKKFPVEMKFQFTIQELICTAKIEEIKKQISNLEK